MRPTNNRPGLRRLMADVAAGKVGRVVVQRFDRLARCPAVFAELLAFLRRHGVELVSATDSPDILGLKGGAA
jgi:DNA invertase Pin-like site-specific DNA recombinase